MESPKKKTRVLVVDDEEWFRQALRACLESAGFEVLAAENGQQGRVMVGLETFDAVVSDIRMAPVNGIELLHFIRQNRPQLPVILMTGFAEISETQEASEMGASGFLAKPFKHEELLELLASLTGEEVQTKTVSRSQDAEFCKLMIDDFVSGRQIKFDIYIRLSDAKYVKIAHQGEDIDISRVKAYKEKGVTYLYLKQEDFREYVGFNVQLSRAVRTSDKIAHEKRLNLLKHTGELVLQSVYAAGVNEETFDYAKVSVESTISAVSNSQDALSLLTLFNDHADFLYTHAVGVSIYSVMIAREMQWVTPGTLFKLGMAGLFHDIGKKEINREILLKARKDLTPDEVKVIESHPMRGIELLSQVKGMPGDVLQVAVQHHENCAGLGYPYRLSKHKIHPFARLVALTDKFCNLVLKGPNSPELSPVEAIEQIRICHEQEFDMAFLPALATVFRVQLPFPAKAAR